MVNFTAGQKKALAAGGGLLLVGGWMALPSLAGAILLAAGGCLVGLWLAPFHLGQPPPSPAGQRAGSSADRLDVMTSSLQEGVLELYTLIELSRMISASLDLDQLLTTTVKTVADTAQVDGYFLYLLDDETGRLALRAAGGEGTESLHEVRLAPGEGLAGRVFQQRKPETYSSAAPFPWPDLPRDARSVLAVPMSARNQSVGAMVLFSPVPGRFSERDVAFFTAVSNQLAIALENARLYGETKELSYRDPLTGVFNRRYFGEMLEQEIQRAKRYRMPLSLIMADIDHFKPYNDLHGHPQGDRVLKQVAGILTANTRQVDIVARYGGEEFTLILPLTAPEPALVVADKLRRSVEEARIPRGDSLTEGSLTISLGIATFPQDAVTGPDLIQSADSALYAAKEEGRNRVVAYRKQPDPTR
jgi:diguanylate cyclase (GGDEF)-like protein